MGSEKRLYSLDSLRTFLIFLVVLTHAGVTYESSGWTASFWIVDDPATSHLPGLVNLILDIFGMFTLFFIAGYFAPASLERKGAWPFLKAKIRRLLLPWALAVFTLMPLYKVIFLYSRGLPQESWTSYFHFSNGILGMSWLWFLPVLFLFDVAYVLLWKLDLLLDHLPLQSAVAVAFLLSVSYSLMATDAQWSGWTKTPFFDFQNERLLPYFLVFLLGSLFARQQAFSSEKRNMKLFIAVNATAWIPINVYLFLLLNLFFRPGVYYFSAGIDGLLLWISFYLSMLSLLYCAIATFKYWFNRPGRLNGALNKLSYNVYIIHVIVLGVIALLLLRIDLPGLVKYPLLALSTWVVSNLLAYGYARVKAALSATTA